MKLPTRTAREAETADGANRRDVFRLLGLGAAASLAACKRLPVEHALPYLVPPEGITPGVPVRYASTCSACPAACGLLVSVLDGRPVKLEGNPAHPLSGGGLCALGQADLRALYDASRLRGPSLGGKAATWEALDAHVAAALAEVKRSGRPLTLLSPTLVSPSEREAAAAFLAPYGGLLVELDAGAASGAARRDAYELLDGRALLPALDFGKADLVVSFGADFLGSGLEPVAHTRAYASRKRAAQKRGLFRHVQIEGSLSLTGAAADERWSATASETRLLAAWLLRHVAEATPDRDGASRVSAALAALPPIPAKGGRAEALRSLADELLSRRGSSLVVASGGDLGEEVAVALTNRLLGNEGTTLDLARPSRVRAGHGRGLDAFREALAAGRVGGVVVLGADPVDQLPDGEALGAAFAKLPLSVALTDRPTATAASCRAVAAAHHGLERWGDFEARDGVVSLAQPAIRPLFDTRDPFESLLRWSGASVTDWRLHLMSRWEARLGGGPGFAARWTAAVAKGGLVELAAPRSEAPAARPRDLDDALRTLLASAATPPDGLEVELVEEVALRDGRRAHVPWLRELPDPLTRTSWAACARLSPSRAARLGVADGDLLSVEAGGKTLTLPARVLPGQHPDVVAVPLGYGRRDGDAEKAATNAYRLARVDGGRLVVRGLAARVTRAAGREALPIVQPHGATEGRPVVYQVARPDEPIESPEHARTESLWPERPHTSPKWELVLDLDACTGCSACVVACQAENNLPVVGASEMARHRDMHWLRIDRYFVGEGENPDVAFSPTMCQQCDNAPCETVCPVAATVHSEDGLNQQVYNRCVGTRYCANNCPYKVRRFNWFDYEVKEPVERMVLNPNVVVRERGVMEKCTFCVQRIQAERIGARKAGHEDWRGLGVKTACQESCPAQAIAFGDATDPDGVVAAWKKSPRAYQLLGELGVGPAVTYLARVRNRTERETRRTG